MNRLSSPICPLYQAIFDNLKPILLRELRIERSTGKLRRHFFKKTLGKNGESKLASSLADSDPHNSSSLPGPVNKSKLCDTLFFNDIFAFTFYDRNLAQLSTRLCVRFKDLLEITKSDHISAVVIFLDSSLLSCLPSRVGICPSSFGHKPLFCPIAQMDAFRILVPGP